MHKATLPKVYRVVVALIFLSSIVYLLSKTDTLDYYKSNSVSILLFVILTTFLVATIFWKYSSPYWKLRDKIVARSRKKKTK